MGNRWQNALDMAPPMTPTIRERLREHLRDAITTATAQNRESIFLRPNDARALLALIEGSDPASPTGFAVYEDEDGGADGPIWIGQREGSDPEDDEDEALMAGDPFVSGELELDTLLTHPTDAGRPPTGSWPK